MLILSKPHISNRSIIGVGKRTLFSNDSFCRGGLVQKREIGYSSHLGTSFLNNLVLVKNRFLGHPQKSQVGFFSLSPKNLHDKKLIASQEELYG